MDASPSDQGGAPDGQKEYAHEMRYLENINGKWKIVHVGEDFYKP